MKGKDVLGSSVVQVDVVMDVQVGTPMTDLCHTLEFLDFQHREVTAVVDSQWFLVRLDELRTDRLWNIAEWSISNSRTRLGRDTVCCEFVYAFGCSVGKNVGAR